MKYLKYFTILLAIFVIASMFLVSIVSSNPPPEPDLAPVISFRDWMKQWEKDNMDPAAKDVHDAYDRFSGLVGDYRSAIRDVGDIAFSAVSNAVQDKWVGMVMSLYSTSKNLATNIAKTQTLQSAVEEAASHHSTYSYNYNELYDRHGTITEGTVAAQVNQEIAKHGGIVISASTMMEAYWKYEFIVRDYNAKVDAWNAYAPSQAKSKVFTTVPSKTVFKKFTCFGSCGLSADTLYYARETHKVICDKDRRFAGGKGKKTIRKCNHLYYHCETTTCPSSNKHINGNAVNPSPPTTPTSPAPVMHACGVHETSVSGNHSWVYETCPSGHARYACDGTDHSVQASCSVTNSSGIRCSVTSFYACETHTHVFRCSACNVRINATNAAAHALVTCTGNVGKTCRQQYYACQSNNHKVVYCQRGAFCPRYTLWGSVYWTRACMPNPNTCINGWKHILQ